MIGVNMVGKGCSSQQFFDKCECVRILFDVSLDVHHSVFSMFPLTFVYINIHVSVYVFA